MFDEKTKGDIALELHRIGAVKFGEFLLKSGMKSPIYIDLRLLVSYPQTLQRVASLMLDMTRSLPYDRVAGIPYAALPIATAFSIQSNKPMLYPRKEVKDYGTKKQIEGLFNAGETVLVIDDLVTTAQSKFETIAPLEAAGLRVRDIAVLIDREQGGRKQLEEKGYRLHSALTMTEMLRVLQGAGAVTSQQADEVRANIIENTATKRTFEFK